MKNPDQLALAIPDAAICNECGLAFRDHDWQGECPDDPAAVRAGQIFDAPDKRPDPLLSNQPGCENCPARLHSIDCHNCGGLLCLACCRHNTKGNRR